MLDVIVVKCGGSTLQELSSDFFLSIKRLKEQQLSPIIVHGGGPEINTLLQKLDVESEFVNGLRKTTDEVLHVAEMVLNGKVNKWIVTKLQQAGVTSIGICGIDGNLLTAVPINKEDLGFVGDVESVNGLLLEKLLTLNIVPVISPIGVDKVGNHYNINADTAAAAIANSLHATKMVFVTDVPGILKNNELQTTVSTVEVEMMIEDGTIYGGMIPKVKGAMKCLQGNVKEVYIIDGKSNKLLKDNGELHGTKIIKNEQVSII